MMIAVGERSRVEGRLEEANALVRDGLATAVVEAAAAARDEERAVAAGIAALVPASGGEPHRAVVAAATAATRAAERRSRLADVATARAANAAARVQSDKGDARAAETFRRVALAAAERARGPAHPSVASTLVALGACAVARRRVEDADACFRHAVGVDENAARNATNGRGRAKKTMGGFSHPRVASHLASLASTRRDAGRPSEAEALYCAAMEAWETRDRSVPRRRTNPRGGRSDAVDVARRRVHLRRVFDAGAALNASVCRVKTKAGGRRRAAFRTRGGARRRSNARRRTRRGRARVARGVGGDVRASV